MGLLRCLLLTGAAALQPRNAPAGRPAQLARLKASLPQALIKQFGASALALTAWTGGIAVSLAPQDAYAAKASNAQTSQGSRVNKDAESLLRYGLPMENPAARELQKAVEEIKDNLKAKRISAAGNAVEQAKRVLNAKADKIAVGPFEAEISEKLAQIQAELAPIGSILLDLKASGSPQERAALDDAGARQARASQLVTQVEARLVPAGYKAVVPAEYSNLPRLDGRARVEFTFRKAEKGGQFAIDSVLYDEAKLEVIVDGYTAPLTAGNFLDLVKNKYYTNMAIQRSDGFVVQTGDPDGPDGPLYGYAPDGKTVRTIPLEIAVNVDDQPMYGSTTEDDLRGAAQTKLPFQSYGALGMARNEYEADSASSQFFFLLFDSDLTPAGKNLLDGRYACFGYTVKGEDFLSDIKEGDIITSARIIRAPAPFGDYSGLDP
ncbi:cyclophilin type peptidyl-prolyl cis-trans isomerase/CLD-domain-containing protein [Pelagophyceae sp. CCMP2097]|nr:cyclophilin type peptidyl-prolyl cis-trans isomerase/CLD-domain-containing protein [Pelagophyceae sp. CCMP2097]